MNGDDNEQGPPAVQAITQACCNEHPPTGVLIPRQLHTHACTRTQVPPFTQKGTLKHGFICTLEVRAHIC